MDSFLLEIGPLNINYCSNAERIHPQNSSDGTQKRTAKECASFKKKNS